MTAVKKKLDVQQLVLCATFTALIAIGAFIRIPVPLIPFTLQLFFVTMAGFLLGPKTGTVSAGLYLGLGLVGLPIFAEGGGPTYVLKPTFGYIIGFVLAAAGSAVGVGNLWRFPYLAAKDGGCRETRM